MSLIRLAALRVGILLDRTDGKETDELQQLSRVCLVYVLSTPQYNYLFFSVRSSIHTPEVSSMRAEVRLQPRSCWIMLG